METQAIEFTFFIIHSQLKLVVYPTALTGIAGIFPESLEFYRNLRVSLKLHRLKYYQIVSFCFFKCGEQMFY